MIGNLFRQQSNASFPYGSGYYRRDGRTFGNFNIGVLSQTYPLPTFSAVHTILAVVAITVSINAFNMIDGIDGLAASMALLALTHAVIAFDLIIGGAPRQITLHSHSLFQAL